MKSIENKSVMENKSILIFGAGKIGRSFIGQLFGLAGYEVIFSDVDLEIVNALNQRKCYPVVIKGEKEETLLVHNIRAVSGLNQEQIVKEISQASLLAVSVGKNALEKVVPLIGEGLKIRYQLNQNLPLDIIIAENMRSAGEFIHEKLSSCLPEEYPIDRLVGLVETSIGKMVPIMRQADLENDPLMVFAEPYNSLIVDKKGFKGAVPLVEGLCPKDNIKAWVDRKAFIHNLGHATAAYYGYSLQPDAVYMYEVLDDCEVFRFTRDIMLQSADILSTVYPKDFTASDLEDHIDDLIYRFRNKALQDTIFRVGQDLTRKLGADDRFMGSIHLAMQYRMPYDLILKAMSYGLCFKAKDEKGNLFPPDIAFLEALSKEFESTLIKDLVLDPKADCFIIEELKKLFKVLRYDFKVNS